MDIFVNLCIFIWLAELINHSNGIEGKKIYFPVILEKRFPKLQCCLNRVLIPTYR